MSYLGIITPPIRSIQWTPPNPLAWASRSAWDKSRQVIDAGGREPWRASITPSTATLENHRAWKLWFGLCNGPTNTFGVPVVERDQHAFPELTVQTTTAAGFMQVPLYNGDELQTYLRAGDHITVLDTSGFYQLLTLSQDFATDAFGQGIAYVVEPLRRPVGGGNPIESIRPFAHVALSGARPGWSVEPGPVYSPAPFAVEEVF